MSSTILLLLSLFTGFALSAPLTVSAKEDVEIEFFTDTEGRYDLVDELIRDRVLSVNAGGELDFVRPNTVLVFGGDLCDRGPSCLKLLEQMASLKERYPTRFRVILGNRDGNKLSYLYFRKSLGSNGGYRDYLRKKIGTEAGDEAAVRQLDVPANRILYWAEQFGLLPAIENHQIELAERKGVSVTLPEAAADFEKLITDPKGAYFRFMSGGELAAEVDGWTFVHGGLPSTKGFVPGESTVYKDFDTWAPPTNRFYKTRLRALVDGVSSGNLPADGMQLVEYMDALYDYGVKSTWNHDNSTIYAPRAREGNNFRTTAEEIEWLKKSGKKGLIVGHSPAGNLPQPNIIDGIVKLYGDCSYTENGKRTRISIRGDVISVKGKLGDGSKLNYAFSAKDSGPMGKLVDGKTIIATTPDGRHVGFEYQGRTIAETVLSPSETKPANLRDATQVIDEVSEKQKKALLSGLDARGIRNYDSMDQVEDILQGRSPVYFMGSSSYVDQTQMAEANKSIESALEALDPSRVVIFTGGTDRGMEKEVARMAKGKGFRVYAQTVSAALPQDIAADLDGVFWVGHRWENQVIAAMDLIKSKNSFAVGLAGGGILRTGFEYGEKIGASVLYSRTLLHGNGSQSASMDFAKKYSKLSFDEAGGLSRLIKKYGFPLAKKKISYLSADQSIASLRARGKKVATFVGYSGAEYQDEAGARARIRHELSVLDPKTYVVSAGGTPEGIGMVYEEAKKMNFTTFSQVSSEVKESYLSGFVDEHHIIKSQSWGGYLKGTKKLDNVSKAIVASTDLLIVIGGGAVGRDEAAEMIARGVPTRAFAFEMNHAVAAKKALKAGKPAPTEFRGDAVRHLFGDGEGLKGSGMLTFNMSEKMQRLYCQKIITK